MRWSVALPVTGQHHGWPARVLWAAPLLLTLVLSACSDQAVNANNTPPTASISLPSVGTEVLEGADVTFLGSVQDRTTPEANLVITWSSSLDGELLAGNPDADGTTTFVTSELSSGTHAITLQVLDNDGASAQATVDLVVVADSPPTISIVDPATDGVYYSNLPITLQATADDSEDLPPDLRISWGIDNGADLVSDLAPDSSGLSTSSTTLDAGTYVLIATVTDSGQNTRTDTVTISVGPPNTAPTCAITAPETAASFPIGDLVTFEGEVADTDVPSDWLVVEFDSNIDGPLGSVSPSTNGDVAFAINSLSATTHTITMSVEDEVGGTCSAFVLTTISTPPTAQISEPTSGSTVNDTDTVAFSGVVTDIEEAENNLSAEWTSSLDGSLGFSAPDSSGLVGLPVSDLSPGAHVVTLTASDSVGLTGTDTITLSVNASPTTPVVSISPAVPSSWEDIFVVIDVASTDPDAGPSPITYSYEWSINGNPAPAFSGLTTIPAVNTTSFETWSVAVSASDGLGTSAPAMAAVAVGNSAPSIASVTITPAVGLDSTTYTATPTGWFDADGDPPAYQYQWYTTAGQVLGATTPTLTPVGEPAGTQLWCEVTPWDGQSLGLLVSSNLAAVNTPPAVVGVAVTPPAGNETTTFAAAYASTIDPDPQAVTVAWQWNVNGAPVPAGTSSTLTGASFDKGQTVTVTGTPNDGFENGVPVTSTGVVVGNSPPSLSGATISPTSGDEATTFNCIPAGWSDPDPADTTPGYSWQWTVNGALSLATQSITGVDFDSGDSLGCAITPTDGFDAGVPVSATPVVIGNTPPSISGVAVSPVSGGENTAFSCVPSGWTDVDGDPPSYTWQWTVNGTPSITSQFVTGLSFDKGQSIACTVTPIDAFSPGASLSSSPVVISNTPPTLSSVGITPTSGNESTTFTCNPTGWNDVDPADTLPGYSYTWSVDGVPSVNTQTISGASFSAGQAISCAVTPTDGFMPGTPVSSASVTIDNTAPSITSVTVGPTSGGEATTFSCNPAGWFDIDGDLPGYTWVWTVNGAASVTTQSINGSDFNKNESIACTATPTDGVTPGVPLASSPVVISNTAPAISSVGINPTTGGETTIFSCTPLGWNDLDPADAVPSYTWSWVVNGTASVTTQDITGTEFDSGDSIVCTATPTDGTASGSPITSAPVTVVNTPPSIASVAITPSPAYTLTLLTATPSGWVDPDGASPSYLYQWFNGVSPVGTDSPTLSGSTFAEGDSITVIVTPLDATSQGTPVASNPLVIANSPPTSPGVSVTPVGADELDDLTCAVTSQSTDDDPTDNVTYSFAWVLNGAPTLFTGATLFAGNTLPGETWTCEVTPNDGQVNGPVGSDSEGPIQLQCIPGDGSDQVCPAEHCGAILTNGFSTGDGQYWVDPDLDGLDPFLAYCDMTTDGGGWMLVAALANRRARAAAPGPFFTQNLTQGSSAWTVDTINTLADPSDRGVMKVDTFGTPDQIRYRMLDTATGTEHNKIVFDDPQSVAHLQDYSTTRHLRANGAIGDSTAHGDNSVYFLADDFEDIWMFDGVFGRWRGGMSGWQFGVSVNKPDDIPAYNGINDDQNRTDLNLGVAGYSTTADISGFWPAECETGCVDEDWSLPASWAERAVVEVWHGWSTNCLSTTASQGFDFVRLCEGVFDMGCTAGQTSCAADETPVHQVTLTNEFWMGETEVTQSQWQSVMGNASAFFVSCGSDCPTESLNWWEAAELTNTMSAAEGLDECFTLMGCTGVAGGSFSCQSSLINSPTGSVYDCEGYRLPTEAEWEYAARATTDLRYSGSNTAGSVAWYSANAGNGTNPVATRSPNGWGLYDMSGNVWEWVFDRYSATYYTSSAVTNPEGPATGGDRVCRPSGYNRGAQQARVSNRDVNNVGFTSASVGLRVARSVPVDSDGDGYFMHEDCNDTDASIYPDAGDTYGDGEDTDCDGMDCAAGDVGGSYFAVCPSTTDWSSSETLCQAAGYDGLASILSGSENSFLHSLISTVPSPPSQLYWVGLNDIAAEAIWEWASGEAVSFLNWDTGEPNNGGGSEDCVQLYNPSSPPFGAWNDANCSSAGSFVCEVR